MTNQDAIKRLKSDIYEYADFTENPNENEFWTAFDMAIKALEQRWIPVKTRPITQDEIEEFGWEDKDESWMWMYDCELPDDGQEVLIQSKYGIDFTTFYNEGSEGCYFEYYEDRGDVIAWMPLPEPYKAESEE